MKYLILIFALAVTPATYANDRHSDKNLFENEVRSCQKIHEILTAQIGVGNVVLFIKDLSAPVNGDLVSIDDNIVKVAADTLPGDPVVTLYVPVCSIRAVGLVQD